MSVLASLARAYHRLPDAPPFGYVVQGPGGDPATTLPCRVG